MRSYDLVKFPDVSEADGDGLLAISRDVSIEHLVPAYLSGVFPWPAEESCVLWFAPPKRAVLDFEDFKVSKKLQRELRKASFSLKIDTRFEEIMRSCAAQPRKGQDGTWITPKMLRAYKELHKEGFAKSFEVYMPDGELAGGLYGVLMGRYFSGESMFHHVSGASKFALVELVAWLKSQGLTWLDAQVMTPLLESFGAKEIPRGEFMKRVARDCFLPKSQPGG